MSIVIVKAIETSTACPSQWDAWDDQGRYWYLRYRYGHGTAKRITAGPDWPETWQPGDEPEEVLSFDYGHPLDGSISLEDFAEKAGLTLRLAEYQDFAGHLKDELRKRRIDL